MKTIAYLSTRILISLTLFVTACSPNGEFTLLNGQKHSLDDFKGGWVVINFWAEWCAPCLEEIPALNQLAKTGEEQGITVIGVSYDPLETAELKAITKKWQFEYAVMATEPVPILPFKLPATLPTNYLLDPDGNVVRKLVGKQDYQSLISAIEHAKQKSELK